MTVLSISLESAYREERNNLKQLRLKYDSDVANNNTVDGIVEETEGKLPVLIQEDLYNPLQRENTDDSMAYSISSDFSEYLKSPASDTVDGSHSPNLDFSVKQFPYEIIKDSILAERAKDLCDSGVQTDNTYNSDFQPAVTSTPNELTPDFPSSNCASPCARQTEIDHRFNASSSSKQTETDTLCNETIACQTERCPIDTRQEIISTTPTDYWTTLQEYTKNPPIGQEITDISASIENPKTKMTVRKSITNFPGESETQLTENEITPNLRGIDTDSAQLHDMRNNISSIGLEGLGFDLAVTENAIKLTSKYISDSISPLDIPKQELNSLSMSDLQRMSDVDKFSKNQNNSTETGDLMGPQASHHISTQCEFKKGATVTELLELHENNRKIRTDIQTETDIQTDADTNRQLQQEDFKPLVNDSLEHEDNHREEKSLAERYWESKNAFSQLHSRVGKAEQKIISSDTYSFKLPMKNENQHEDECNDESLLPNDAELAAIQYLNSTTEETNAFELLESATIKPEKPSQDKCTSDIDKPINSDDFDISHSNSNNHIELLRTFFSHKERETERLHEHGVNIDTTLTSNYECHGKLEMPFECQINHEKVDNYQLSKNTPKALFLKNNDTIATYQESTLRTHQSLGSIPGKRKETVGPHDEYASKNLCDLILSSGESNIEEQSGTVLSSNVNAEEGNDNSLNKSEETKKSINQSVESTHFSSIYISEEKNINDFLSNEINAEKFSQNITPMNCETADRQPDKVLLEHNPIIEKLTGGFTSSRDQGQLEHSSPCHTSLGVKQTNCDVINENITEETERELKTVIPSSKIKTDELMTERSAIATHTLTESDTEKITANIHPLLNTAARKPFKATNTSSESTPVKTTTDDVTNADSVTEAPPKIFHELNESSIKENPENLSSLGQRVAEALPKTSKPSNESVAEGKHENAPSSIDYTTDSLSIAVNTPGTPITDRQLVNVNLAGTEIPVREPEIIRQCNERIEDQSPGKNHQIKGIINESETNHVILSPKSPQPQDRNCINIHSNQTDTERQKKSFSSKSKQMTEEGQKNNLLLAAHDREELLEPSPSANKLARVNDSESVLPSSEVTLKNSESLAVQIKQPTSEKCEQTTLSLNFSNIEDHLENIYHQQKYPKMSHTENVPQPNGDCCFANSHNKILMSRETEGEENAEIFPGPYESVNILQGDTAVPSNEYNSLNLSESALHSFEAGMKEGLQNSYSLEKVVTDSNERTNEYQKEIIETEGLVTYKQAHNFFQSNTSNVRQLEHHFNEDTTKRKSKIAETTESISTQQKPTVGNEEDRQYYQENQQKESVISKLENGGAVLYESNLPEKETLKRKQFKVQQLLLGTERDQPPKQQKQILQNLTNQRQQDLVDQQKTQHCEENKKPRQPENLDIAEAQSGKHFAKNLIRTKCPNWNKSPELHTIVKQEQSYIYYDNLDAGDFSSEPSTVCNVLKETNRAVSDFHMQVEETLETNNRPNNTEVFKFPEIPRSTSPNYAQKRSSTVCRDSHSTQTINGNESELMQKRDYPSKPVIETMTYVTQVSQDETKIAKIVSNETHLARLQRCLSNMKTANRCENIINLDPMNNFIPRTTESYFHEIHKELQSEIGVETSPHTSFSTVRYVEGGCESFDKDGEVKEAKLMTSPNYENNAITSPIYTNNQTSSSALRPNKRWSMNSEAEFRINKDTWKARRSLQKARQKYNKLLKQFNELTSDKSLIEDELSGTKSCYDLVLKFKNQLETELERARERLTIYQDSIREEDNVAGNEQESKINDRNNRNAREMSSITVTEGSIITEAKFDKTPSSQRLSQGFPAEERSSSSTSRLSSSDYDMLWCGHSTPGRSEKLSLAAIENTEIRKELLLTKLEKNRLEAVLSCIIAETRGDPTKLTSIKHMMSSKSTLSSSASCSSIPASLGRPSSQVSFLLRVLTVSKYN